MFVHASPLVLALSFAIAAAPFAAGAQTADPKPAQPSRTIMPAPRDGNATAEATQRDGDAQALGLLATLNENEIAAARQAQQKGVTGSTLEFAKLMQTEHGKNLQQTKQLGPLGKGAQVDQLKQKGQQELTMLSKHQGKDYEAAYAKAMVKGHQEALQLIDTRLVEMARAPAIKAHLAETRKHVAMHLQAAQALPGANSTAAR